MCRCYEILRLVDSIFIVSTTMQNKCDSNRISNVHSKVAKYLRKFMHIQCFIFHKKKNIINSLSTTLDISHKVKNITFFHTKVFKM